MKKINKIKFTNILLHCKAFIIDLMIWNYSLAIVDFFIYQKFIINSRYFEFSWEQEFILLFLSLLIAFLQILIPNLSVGKLIYKRKNVKNNNQYWKNPRFFIVLIIILLTFYAGFFIADISPKEFFSKSGFQGVKRILWALLSPNWNILNIVLLAAIETVYMALMATVLALPLAVILGFLAARNLMKSSPHLYIIYILIRFFLNIIRAIEPLIWAVIFSIWVGIGPFAGMMALSFHSIASLAKLYSEQIESVEMGPMEAIMATGAHPVQVIWFGLIPQIIIPFLSFTIYRWDINVRMATIIGLVGGGGIGNLLMQYQGVAQWNEVGLIVMIIAFIVWLMDYFSAKIREVIK